MIITSLLVFESLTTTQTHEFSIHHYTQPGAQSITLCHTIEEKDSSTFEMKYIVINENNIFLMEFYIKYQRKLVCCKYVYL